MRLLESGTDDIKEEAAEVMQNLAWKGDNETGGPNPAISRAMVAAGAVPILLAMLKGDLRRSALGALANIAVDQEARSLMRQAGWCRSFLRR